MEENTILSLDYTKLWNTGITTFEVPGYETTLFISKKGEFYYLNILKNKYAKNKKLQEIDQLLLSDLEIKELFDWVLSINPENYGADYFGFNRDKSPVIHCHCYSEVLIAYYDDYYDDITFVLYDNYFLKKKYHKKQSCEFCVNRKDFIKILKKTIYYI